MSWTFLSVLKRSLCVVSGKSFSSDTTTDFNKAPEKGMVTNRYECHSKKPPALPWRSGPFRAAWRRNERKRAPAHVVEVDVVV